jgi:transcriptional regulator GlxA family with amidase domain
LRPERISALLLDAGTAPARPSALRGLHVSDAPPDLEDAMARLLRLLDAPSDLPVLSAAIEREILWRVLSGGQGELLRQIGLADSGTTRIGIAVRRIRQGYADKLRIDELAVSVGMSVPSFHRHFRAVTSMTPIQYQKNLRLHVARSRLMAGSEDVSTVGFDVGYDSLSQFSREYKRLFGRPPGQDGAYLRQMDQSARER